MPSPASMQAQARASLIASITTWTRLEPQPRDASMDRSLQAQVRDALWMLARQWQVGEFAGDDAGSPVQATMGVQTQPLTGYRPGPPGTATLPFDGTIPLEAHVELQESRSCDRDASKRGSRVKIMNAVPQLSLIHI